MLGAKTCYGAKTQTILDSNNSMAKYQWEPKEGTEATELELRILEFEKQGVLVPPRRVVLNQEQIEGIRKSAQINTGVLDEVAKHISAGMTTEEIDQIVHNYTVQHGAIPAPLNYQGFPKSVCTSLNAQVCHGIPSPTVKLKEGDIVNVDVSTILNGYYSDASRMFMIGEVSKEVQRLVRVTMECLQIGMRAAQPWGRVGDIGQAIQTHAERNGYSVVRELCGHGVGLKFHEVPEVLHYGKRNTGMLLVPGMVFTIEPMINMGSHKVFIDKQNHWTIYTQDAKPCAQWEHTFLMTESGLEVLTR